MADSESMSKARSQKHIALVAGGTSTERDISLGSAKTVAKALTSAGYQFTFIDMDADIAAKLSALKPDIVFNCLHGGLGEDGSLPGLLNIMGLPYTHSGVFASSMASDKIKAKQWFRLIGVATAQSVVIYKHEVTGRAADPMDRPYIIKPRAQGGTIGVKIVLEGTDFNFANYTFPYGDQVLVERFIKGREFTVAVLNGRALGAMEVPNPTSYRNYEAKYGKKISKSSDLPPISSSLHAQLLDSAEMIFKSLDCRGPARLDYVLEDGTEQIFVLEINAMPGLREVESHYPKITASCAGVSMRYIVDEIVKSACCDPQ